MKMVSNMTSFEQFLAELHETECRSSQEEHPLSHQAHRIIEQLAEMVSHSECCNTVHLRGNNYECSCGRERDIGSIIDRCTK